MCAASSDSSSVFDPEAAARAYLSRQTPAEKARSDAYFEGGYWLILWDFVYGAAVAGLLLTTRLSARLSQNAKRLTRFKPLQTAAYFVQFILLTALLQLPLTVYESYFRERHYGMATQKLGSWFGDWALGLLVSVVLTSVAGMVLFGLVRRLQRTWHIWGAVFSVAFLGLIIVIAPVFIDPLFNKYTVLEDQTVVHPILSLARANGIPADKVYEMDASRQTTRVSANVSGLLGTMRVRLNDNLLRRCSLPEIKAVMGHEMGHYVLNHIYKILLGTGVAIAIGFALLRWALAGLLGRYGSRWGITAIDDPAVTPLVVLLFSCYSFLLTPFSNSFIRTMEMEADRFGLNAAREPDGFAEVSLKLGEYRKLQPGPLEEWFFFDHPSGATRIRTAMHWKAENPTAGTALPVLTNAAMLTMGEVLTNSKAADWRPLDPQNTLYLELPAGRVIIELAPEFAPQHVANVKALAREGYYDGLAILRCQDNYVVQWGDPNAEKPEAKRAIQKAHATLPPEFTRPIGSKLPFTRLLDGDVYAPEVGFSGGFPVARDRSTGKMWLVHEYGMVGAGRDNAPDSGGGTELYVVIGQAPRHLDRNVTLLGRVVQGMELLSALPRGRGAMGFYDQPEQRVPLKAVRVAADLPPEQRTPLEVMRTDTPTFQALVESRRNRRESWFITPAGHIELSSVPLPVRAGEN